MTRQQYIRALYARRQRQQALYLARLRQQHPARHTAPPPRRLPHPLGLPPPPRIVKVPGVVTSPPPPPIIQAVARAVPEVGVLIGAVQTGGALLAGAINAITGGDDARTIAERQQRMIDAQNQYDSQLAAAVAQANPDASPAQVAAQVQAMQDASTSGGGGGIISDYSDFAER